MVYNIFNFYFYVKEKAEKEQAQVAACFSCPAYKENKIAQKQNRP